ncbi:LuxR C-terminal-related transcriptional regulator [Streptomyces mirabilis]|uniref:LuxR C-terminal-related transcriptional regulator n=1 Tax=Streptomyces mirabilis TaxID=68239 RepID=UPI00332F361F
MTGPSLSQREADVLRRVANGETYRQLASDWGVEEVTVRTTGVRVMRKLGANTIAHAVHLAHLAGILRRERHGDHAGFAAHRYRGEDPWACTQGCPEGERTYRADQRQRRRQEAAGGPQGAPEAENGARDVREAAGATEGRTGLRGEAAA